MKAPIIGVTTGRHATGHAWYAPYAEAIQEAGGSPLYLDSSSASPKDLPSILKSIDGLLLTGGVDVHPGNFTSRNQPGDADLSDDEIILRYMMECDTDRDSYEVPLAKAAYEARRIPILGICRGFQLLNVVLGGTLVKDIHSDIEHRSLQTSDDPDAPRKSSMHPVRLIPGSRIAELLPEDLDTVNSRHHQGIIESGISSQLKPVAFAPDGIVEAYESIDHPWTLAVEWHPERRVDTYIYEPCRPLFKALIAESS